jgi:hypothetical protein
MSELSPMKEAFGCYKINSKNRNNGEGYTQI